MNAGGSLSSEEMEALLAAVRAGRVPVSPGGKEPAVEPVPYNFLRPSRVSKEHVRGLLLLHEEWANLVSASLSAMTRSIVEVELESVEQIAYSEYVAAMSPPTCAFLFRMEPLEGGAVLDLNAGAAFVMMDRLLGGQGQGVPAPRELTEIERAVVQRVGQRALEDLQQAWQKIGAFSLRPANLETNPTLIQVTAPNEIVLVATFQLKMGEVLAGMTLGYPYLLLEPIVERLGGLRWTPAKAGDGCRPLIARALAHTALDVRACLGRGRLRVRDVLGLAPGQLVPLAARRETPVSVLLNDVPKYGGRLGTHRTHLAVEILGRLHEEGMDL